jgi:hypothetical protein
VDLEAQPGRNNGRLEPGCQLHIEARSVLTRPSLHRRQTSNRTGIPPSCCSRSACGASEHNRQQPAHERRRNKHRRRTARSTLRPPMWPVRGFET